MAVFMRAVFRWLAERPKCPGGAFGRPQAASQDRARSLALADEAYALEFVHNTVARPRVHVINALTTDEVEVTTTPPRHCGAGTRPPCSQTRLRWQRYPDEL